MKRTFLVILVIINLLYSKEGVKKEKILLVETVEIERQKVAVYENFLGNIIFTQSSNIASQSSGLVQKVGFESGDIIKKNQVLVELDTSIIDAKIQSSLARLEEAKINLENAMKALKRYEALKKEDAVSLSAYDNVYTKAIALKNNLASLEASIQVDKIEKQKKTTYAPFDGIATDKNVEIGAWVNAGSKIANIVNLKTAEIEVNLPWQKAKSIHKNDIVQIFFDNEVYSGFVRAVVPKADLSSRTFPIKISFKEMPEDIFEGMDVNVKIATEKERQLFVVPRDAVVRSMGNDVVYTIENNKAIPISVEIEEYLVKNIAVVSNFLKPKMQIITKGNERIYPEAPVKVAKK